VLFGILSHCLPPPPPQGLVVTVLEAGALCAFVILVATLLGPLPTLLLIPGIYAFTGMLRMCCCCCSYFQFKGATRSQYDTECTRRLKRLGAVLDNPFFGFVGMATQVAGLIGAGVFTLYKGKILNENVANIDNFQNVVMVKMVGCMVAVPLLLSILWSAAVQKLIYHSSPKTKGKTDGNQSRNSSDKLPASRRGGTYGDSSPHLNLLICVCAPYGECTTPSLPIMQILPLDYTLVLLNDLRGLLQGVVPPTHYNPHLPLSHRFSLCWDTTGCDTIHCVRVCSFQ